MSPQKTVVVIGGGPGGYAAAIYLAHLGAKVTLVEKQYLGGTCLNVGCIPTKAFVEASSRYVAIREAAVFGLKVEGEVTVEGKKLARFKNNVVKQLRGGVGYLLSSAGVDVISGVARLTGPDTVEVVLADGCSQSISADAIVLSTGSSEIELPGLAFDGQYVLNSTHMLDMMKLPESIVIIGGGVIGVEFASIFSSFCKKVTIVELTASLLPTEDRETAETLREYMSQQGVEVLTETKAKSVSRKSEAGVTLQLENVSGQISELTAEKVLVCVGRSANIKDIGLEAAGVSAAGKFIPTDERMRTNVKGIYAVGDITASPQLAHVAYHEARVAALDIMGKGDETAEYTAVPYCIFSHPEVARVGFTEEEARERYRKVKVVKESFFGNGKALIQQENIGFIKMLIDEDTGRLVGCSIIGPKATELIAEPSLAIKLGLDVASLSTNINTHPSLSETIGETAAAAIGLKLHSV